jgi:hypothetical protein
VLLDDIEDLQNNNKPKQKVSSKHCCKGGLSTPLGFGHALLHPFETFDMLET